jgi:DNA-binding response OmpR family regulator
VSRILVVEDEPEIAASLRSLLERDGYVVDVAGTIAEARRALRKDVDAMLLDWRLPDGEGIDLLKELRLTSDLPVLLVTARVEVIDKVLGLELGADDYVTKPVEPRELLARIKARLRPRGREKTTALPPRRVLEVHGVRIDLERREVTFGGRAVTMTKMELDLLALLAEFPGRVFSREELLNRVWGYERMPTTRTVDTHVVQLRTKLRGDLIESVRGIGYRLVRELTEPAP